MKFNPLAQYAHNTAVAAGYPDAPTARNEQRRLALRAARHLLQRAELAQAGRVDPELAQDIATFLPQIATLV